jgi:Response regulator containing a CheY-like receiver domain and an HTH DNA-binding domain
VEIMEVHMNGHFLTPRELEIFKMLIKNETTKSIASKLHISDKTVRNHISNVIGKLGVTSRTQAIIMLAKSGMIEI